MSHAMLVGLLRVTTHIMFGAYNSIQGTMYGNMGQVQTFTHCAPEAHNLHVSNIGKYIFFG